MLFSKKKKDSKVTLMHYEGLQGFRQDFPCKADVDDSCIIFTNENNGTIKLPFAQIQSIDYMPEMNFMGKYHNNPVSTAKMGVKWFSVVSYTSSSGESKYLAFWSVDSTGRKFFDKIRTNISSGSITLSGFRISELLSLETAKINLEDIPYFQGGVKTKAGKDRIVPIHPLILDFVKARVQEGNKYLISVNGKKISNSQYYIIWNQFMKKLNQEHTPHECRHTFRSRLDSAGANKVCIDLMMGHKSHEVGERVYTHKTLEELQNALALVTS